MYRKGLCIGQMQVQHIELGDLHGVYSTFEQLDWDEMSRYIHLHMRDMF